MSGGEGEGAWTEKIAEIRQYSGARYAAVPRAAAGELCCVTGLTRARPGDGFGTERRGGEQTLRPCYACRVIPGPGEDLHRVLDCLQTLTEEEPLIQAEFLEARREIRVHSMGDVYLEVLRRRRVWGITNPCAITRRCTCCWNPCPRAAGSGLPQT